MTTTDDRETAWADINPPMALAPRPAPQSVCSARLQPANRTEFRNELTACLALVAPAGMDENARGEWLAVAWETLKHLPADLLAIGARKARLTCDHPAKIVPTIAAETAELLKWRREEARPTRERLPPPTRKHVMDRRGEAMSEEDTAELNRILENAGAFLRYRPDGSKYRVEVRESEPPAVATRRKPTRADYIALGVDPAVLDSIE